MAKRAISLSLQNFKGGAGKTTISMNIAHVLSLAGYKVLFVDMDEQGSASEQLNVFDDVYDPRNQDQISYTKQDILDLDLLALMVQSVDIHKYIKCTKYPNIYIIPNARSMSDSAPFDSQFDLINLPVEKKYTALYDNLEKIREEYDYIIIDGQPHAGRMTELSMIISDYVLTPIDTDQYNINTVLDVTDKISILNSTLKIQIQFVGFFLNKAVPKEGSDIELRKYYMENYKDFFIDHPVRFSYNASRKSGFSGKLFLDYNKRTGPALDILNLVINELKMVDEEHLKNLVKNGIPDKYFKNTNALIGTEL